MSNDPVVRATPPSAGLTFRPYQPGDEQSVSALQREALGESQGTKRTSAFWTYKHVDNPFGPSFIRVASDPSGDIIGLRAFMQWHLLIDGRTIRAVEAVDTATRPDHQRQGIFSRLTRQGVDDLRSAGIQLVFNTPNIRSRPGYLKLGWQDAGMLTPLLYTPSAPRLLRGIAGVRLRKAARTENLGAFLSPAAALTDGGLGGSPALEELLVADAGLDQRAGTIRKCRSADYLRWRYERHPNVDYHAVARTTSHRLEALAIFRTNIRFGLKEVLLSELFLADRDEGLCRSLLDEVLRDRGADYVIAHFPEGSFQHRALRRFGFHHVPAWAMSLGAETRLLGLRGVQKPRRLTVLLLDPELPADRLLNVRNWALSEGDLEF